MENKARHIGSQSYLHDQPRKTLDTKVQITLLISITITKASGDDGISAELFQILKDNGVKVLHSIYQQIRKTQKWP